jgi:hypothetical protein
MAVVNTIVGAPTEVGATVVATVDGGGPVRIAVADNAAMTNPVFSGSQAVDAQGVAKVTVTGLAADTRYWWQVADNGAIDTSVTGRMWTLPTAGTPASFRLTVAGCAGLSPTSPGVAGGELDPNKVSNHPVYDDIRARDPRMHVNLGDWGYPNFGTDTTDTLTNRRRYYDDNLAQPRQAQFCRDVQQLVELDDHDFASNDSDGTYADKVNAAAAYRERVPHYPLPDADAMYQSVQVGRVLLVALDVRYFRSPNSDPDGPSKTMLGSVQREWLAGLLAASSAEVLVVLSPSQWLGPSSDGWGNFATERAQLAALFAAHFPARTVLAHSDRHGLGLTGGGTNTAGGFPVLQAGSIDSDFGLAVPDVFDVVPDTPGRGQYGTVDVTDLGSAIVITLTCWRGNTIIGSYPHSISITTPTSVTSAQVHEFAAVISGSHQPVFDARILTGWRTGPDPAGITIAILGGDVAYDATAQVFASLSLTTAGIDEHDEQSRFPRLPSDLFAPYGNELWVRRGVDVGSGVLWASLGYFRIDAAEQDESPYGDITLSGQDRMAHLIDARLVVARTFASSNTVAFVFASLVGEVLPQATILFDDNTATAPLGRRLTAEEDRYAVLAELADSYGKVMYWDGDGFLRVESPPDESTPVWEVAAGSGGVLLTSGRRVTSEGMRNGWVVTGEGGDQQVPVRAVAVDIGASSPTRWGGRFGKRPGFYSSPLIVTEAQAETVARARLLRTLGAPYSADFSDPANPALRPWHPIRVEQRDGNREIHVVSSLTVPLTASQHMSGSTREKTHAVIGRVVS